MSQAFYAGFMRRAGASLLDGLVLWIPFVATTYAGITTGSMWLDSGVDLIIWWFYYACFHASRWQATPGKRAFGIKVTDLTGARIGFGRASWRYVASLLSTLLLLLGFLLALVTRKRQALHDVIAGTLVVNAELQPGALPEDRAVMPLPGKIVAAIVGLAALTIAISWAAITFMTPPAELASNAEAVPAGPSSGPVHELSYAIYKLPLFKDEPELVREGTRKYTLADVLVLHASSTTPIYSVKTLDVADGYSIQAHIHREPRVDGFGLTLEKGFGFSWEWFERSSGDIFRKLQGGGQIQVRLTRVEGGDEVAEILFLDDVTLRLDRHFMVPFTKGKTDHLVVKRGSVLQLAK